MKKFALLVLLAAVSLSAAAQDVAVFPQVGHTSMVNSVAFSSDGRQILSGSADNTVKLWDTNTGREIRSFTGHTNGVNSIAFSPDGRQIVSGSHDNSVRLWDNTTGREIRTFSGHTNFVYSVAFSPDGSQILSGSADNTVKLWDTNTGSVIRTFTCPSWVYSVAFSPDGRQFISGSYDNNIKLWDTNTGREIRSFSGHSGRVNTVAFSPDGRQILSGSQDRSMKLWDTNTGREIRSFSGHTNSVNSVTFSSDGRQILSGSFDNTIKLWDANTGREIRSFSEHTEGIYSVAFSPDGRQIISGSYDYTIKLWDVNTGQEIRTILGLSSWVNSAAFNHNGTQALSGLLDNTVKLWDINTGREIRILTGHTEGVYSVTFNHNGTQALSGSWDNRIKLWDVNTGREIRSFPGDGWVYSAVFSPDGRQALTGSTRALKLWDVNTGREIRSFSGHTNLIRSAVFSPDGSLVLSGSWDNTVKLWDTNTGREIRTFTGHYQPVNSVAFSPDGRQILSGSADRSIKLWDANSGREIRTFSGHTNWVHSVAFSPDGRQILSGSWDNTIKLWDINTGREIRTLQGHSSSIDSARFNHDGTKILSGSVDGTTRLWETSTGREIAQFISFNDGEWIVITPEGFYNASPFGDRYLNVRVGNEVYGIDQWRTNLFQPDIVAARLQGNTNITLPHFRLEDIARSQPPRITIRSPGEGTQFTSAQAELSVVVEDPQQPIREIRVLVNGRLVGDEELIQLSGTRNIRIRTERLEAPPDQRRVEFTVPIRLEPGNNRIQVIATNASAEANAVVEVFYRTNTAFLPNLWILAVGVNKYNSPDIEDLNYAANDAREIVNAFRAQEGRRFNRVHSLLISDEAELKPTRANIVDGLDFLGRASQHDVVLLFMAGHGVNDNRGVFYFLPSDASFGSDRSILRSSAVERSEIMRIRELPGRKLIFLDTCHSGNVGGTGTRAMSMDNTRLIRDIWEPSTFIFTSSTGSQLSQELSHLQHGAFTYAILQGLRGAAHPDANGDITMLALDFFVSRTVSEMTNGAQHPVSSIMDGNYREFVIARTR